MFGLRATILAFVVIAALRCGLGEAEAGPAAGAVDVEGFGHGVLAFSGRRVAAGTGAVLAVIAAWAVALSRG